MTHHGKGRRGLPGGRRYRQRTPAMAIGLADHVWSWEEFFTFRIINTERSDYLYITNCAISATPWMAKHEYDPSVDQPLQTITTQLIPRGGVKDAVEKTLRQIWEHTAEDAREFLRTPPAPIWSLGSVDEDSRRKATEEVLKDLLNVVMPRIRGLLGKRIDEVALDSLTQEAREENISQPRQWAQEQLKQILTNADALAQPTWQLNLDRWGLKDEQIQFISFAAKPENMPENILPASVQGKANPSPDYLVMIMRTRHGAPLHAMVPFYTLKTSYHAWVRNRSKAHSEPLHICKDWNEGKGILEDIYPLEIAVSAENVLYFALGMFTDWLLREQGVEVVEQLIEGHTGNGIAFRRGRNQYYAVIVEETRQGTLRKVEERKLCPRDKRNRMEACKNFDHECVASAKAYMDRLENSIAWEQLERYINKYIVWLRGQINDGKIPRDQGEAEIAALEQYMEQE